MGSRGSVADAQPITRSEVRAVRNNRHKRRRGGLYALLIIVAVMISFGGRNWLAQTVAEDKARAYVADATAVIESHGYKVVTVDATRRMVLIEGDKGEKKWFNIQQDGATMQDFYPVTACAVTTDLRVDVDSCAVNHQQPSP